LEKGVLSSHCFHCLGHFSVGSGRFPRACCGIRAVKGSVRAPGVSVRVVVGVPPTLSRLHCPPPPWAMAERAARAVRGRGGRLRAALWRLRAAPPGLHGERLCFRCIVATRRFPGGMRRYGSPVRCGFWHGMSRYGTPEVVRYVSLCFAMFRSLLRLGPPALSRRRRSSRLRDVALCRALSQAGDLRRSRPPLQWNGCRVCCVAFTLFRIGRDFFREPGRLPGAGARIRAGKGSVRAPGHHVGLPNPGHRGAM
jgi:hypothetical protein